MHRGKGDLVVRFVDGVRYVDTGTCLLEMIREMASDCSGNEICLQRRVKYFDDSLVIAATKCDKIERSRDDEIIWNGEIYLVKNAKELEEYRFWGVANVNAMSIDKMTHEFAQKIDEIANRVGCIEDQLGIMASNIDDGFEMVSRDKGSANIREIVEKMVWPTPSDCVFLALCMFGIAFALILFAPNSPRK